MDNLIINKTDLEVFDTFVQKYGENALVLYPEFDDIQIYAVSIFDTQYAEEVCFYEHDTFGFYFNYIVEPKYAEIIVNEKACRNMCLTEQEMMAAIAHELGHIKYTNINEVDVQDKFSEIFSDDFVCEIGLGKPLSSLLKKFINYGDLPEELSQNIRERLMYISFNLQNNFFTQ